MKSVSLIFLVCIMTNVVAQDIDYNKIILPQKVKTNSFEELLVQLAWKNHPSNKIVVQNVQLAKHEKTAAKFNWLSDIYAVGNLNEFTINPAADLNNRSNFYPKYNFGVRVSLGTLFMTPMQVKITQDNLLNNEYKVSERMILTRSEVLTSLEQLKEQYKLLILRQRLAEDYLIMYNDAEKKFAAGQIELSVYRDAIQAYSARSEQVIQTRSQFNQAKIAVESLVGLRLEEIEGYAEFLRTQEVN